jgi:HAD superfamily hydrolase (TIGR01509 family)
MNAQTPDKNQLKAVLFDMDGVLYNSMQNHADTWMGSFRKFGIAFKAEEAYMNEGRTGKSTIEKVIRETLGREAHPNEAETIYAEKIRLMNDAPPAEPVAGIKEILSLFRRKGLKIIVVTGSNHAGLLEKLNHDFGVAPRDVVAAKDVTQGKPHPEPYLKGLIKAQAKAEQTLVVENAPLGIISARAAGIFTIGLNTGILPDSILAEAGANQVFKNTSLLKTWIEKYLE